jgi:hypothetical protein
MESTNMMNIIQAKLLMDTSSSGGEDNTIRNLAILQLINFAKSTIPKIWTTFYNNYVLVYIQKQKHKISILNDTKSSVRLVKNYKDDSTNNEFNKIDGVMHEIISLINVYSLTYNGSYFYFNFYEPIDIEKHIKFKLISVKHDKHNCGIERIEFEIYSLTKDIQYIRQYIDKCHTIYDDIRKNKLGNQLYYFDTHNNEYSNQPNRLEFQQNKFSTNKKLKNIFFTNKEELDKRLDVFMNNPEWYENNGIPHTFGLLLHGKPGCGKTSTIKGIANVTSRHIINVNLSLLKTNKQLKNLFYNDYINVNMEGGRHETIYVPVYKRLYVMEDIDCMGNNIVLKREYKNNAGTESDSVSCDDSEYEESSGSGDINEHTYAGDFSKSGVKVGLFDTFSDPVWDSSNVLGDKNSTGTSLDDAFNINKTNPLTPKPKPKPKPRHMLRRPRNSDRENTTLPKPVETNPTTIDDPITLSSLLNTLDGTLETPGRIIIMTTNYPDRIDSALIRPGRIDMNIEFTLSTHDMIVDMYENFYDTTFPKNQKHKLINDKLSPATVIQILFKNIHDPPNSIIEMSNKLE